MHRTVGKWFQVRYRGSRTPMNPHRQTPEPRNRGLLALLFVWPAAAATWAVLGLFGVPLFHETGYVAGVAMVAWAATLFAKRHRVRASGVLGWRAPH